MDETTVTGTISQIASSLQLLNRGTMIGIIVTIIVGILGIITAILIYFIPKIIRRQTQYIIVWKKSSVRNRELD